MIERTDHPSSPSHPGVHAEATKVTMARGRGVRFRQPRLWIPLLLCLGTTSSAVSSGFEASLRLQRDWLSVADPTGSENEFAIDQEGGGISLAVGWAFAPTFTLALRAGGAAHTTNYDDDAVYGTLLFEGQWRPRWTGSLQPYLLIGLGGAAVEVPGEVLDTSISGAVASLGAGLLLPLNEHLRVETGVRIDRVNWDRIRVSAAVGDGTIALDAPVEGSGGAAEISLGLGWGF